MTAPVLDRNRCPGPAECGRCLEACDEGVLMARPEKAGAGTETRRYEIVRVLLHRCTGCGRCVSACPEGALTFR